jgi:hypothetical protein
VRRLVSKKPLAIVLIAGALAVSWAAMASSGAAPGGTALAAGAAAAAASSASPAGRIHRTVPRCSSPSEGVRCPDGSYLPLLNGVPAAPPITRSAPLGPLPPVIAVVGDQAGDEWYEHADGSCTTTRRRTVVVAGVPTQTIETVHNARLPDQPVDQRRER